MGDGGKAAVAGPVGWFTMPGPNWERSPQQVVVPSACTAHVVLVSPAMRGAAVTPGTGIGVAVLGELLPRFHGLCGSPSLQPQHEVAPVWSKAHACHSPIAIPATSASDGTGTVTGVHWVTPLLHIGPA